MIYKLFLGFLFFAAACTKHDHTASTKPQVLVSIAPYRHLVEQIAGPDIEVHTIVPQNADPHSFEPTFHQVDDLQQAQIWFLIGEPFEKKIVSMLKDRNPHLKTVDLLDEINLIEEGCCHRDHMDRHVWMSPRETTTQADSIERALSSQFPEKTEEFQKNAAHLKQKLIELDEEIQTTLQDVQNRSVLVSHPAFAYFCRDYHFEQISVEYEGKDPRPKHLEQILQKTAALALALPQYNNKGTRLIAQKLNIPVHTIDPYSDEYFETMRSLAHLLADPYAN